MIQLSERTHSILNLIFDKFRNTRIKQNLLQVIPYLISAVITAVMAVFYAKAFHQAEKLMTFIFQYNAWLMFVISPIAFIVSWWLVKKFAPYAKGSGIPQVMAAVELATPKNNDKINKLLSIRIIIVKVISSIIMVIGGGAIGREGPTIQIAGSVFRKVNELWKNIWPTISRRNMIMTGAAAGLAAAFNTPLGGIVFVVEELTKTHINYFKTAVFTAVIIAGLTAQSIYGPYLYFGFPIIKDLSGYIVFSVILVAVIAGLFGSGMSRLMLAILKWKANFKFNYQHVLYLIFCSLTITSLAYFVNVGILGSGKDLMVQTLFSDDKYLPWYMPLLRIIGPMLSFTTGASAGIFAPGLSAGGTVGSVISGFLELSSSDSNLLILAGMVAFLTGITRAPFTSAILVLEMTDRHSLILYLMLAGILANIVSVFISKHSLYDVLKHQYLHEVLHEESKEPSKPESEETLLDESEIEDEDDDSKKEIIE